MGSMTTTITLAPDVEVRVRAFMRRRGLTFSEAVNEAVRQGLNSAEEDPRVNAPPRSRRGSRTGGAGGPQDALAANDVRSRLVQNLVDDIHAEPFQPFHRRRPYGPEVIGWSQRLRSYFWPDPSMTYERTHRLMAPWFEKAGELSIRLHEVGSWSEAERHRATELVIAG